MSDKDPVDEVDLLVKPDTIPPWYQPLVRSLTNGPVQDITKFRPPVGEAVRRSSVLVLFGGSPEPQAAEPDVLIIQRALDMRSHAGQPAFPGGAQDPEDSGPVATALREAQEETLLDPTGVVPVATLPQMWIRPSGFVVTPVLGWWREPSPVSAGDPAEVASVHRIPIQELVDPANRVRVTHPAGYVGAGFEVNGMLVWGFTGMLLDRLLALGGWEQPWIPGARTVPFDDGWRMPGAPPA